MDQVHIVRHKVLVEGRSQRAVARELGLARVTVRKRRSANTGRTRGESPRTVDARRVFAGHEATAGRQSPPMAAETLRLARLTRAAGGSAFVGPHTG